MTVVINKNNLGEIDELIKQLKKNPTRPIKSSKPFNASKYCGVVKFSGNPLMIQKRLRDEWK
jgi:hypothetical protein